MWKRKHSKKRDKGDTGITSVPDNPNTNGSGNPISHVVREHFVMSVCNNIFLSFFRESMSAWFDHYTGL